MASWSLRRSAAINASSSIRATQVLAEMVDGDSSAAARLFPLVYEELRALAARKLTHERFDHTLQATAVVHEAFLRLIDQKECGWTNRAHFMAVAARAMRQLLIDHARAKRSAKRGGRWKRVTLSEPSNPEQADTVDLLALDEALTKLTALDERMSRIVELRFFAGLTIAETSEVLGVSTTTVEDDWSMARAWLIQAIGGEREQ